MDTGYISTQHMKDMLALKDGEIKALKKSLMDKEVEILKLKLELNLLESGQTAKKS